MEHWQTLMDMQKIFYSIVQLIMDSYLQLLVVVKLPTYVIIITKLLEIGWLCWVALGGGSYAGAFCWLLANASSSRARSIGARLLYIP